MKNRDQRTAVKICGLTSVEEAGILNQYGADYAGMVLFCERSKRNIPVARAKEILAALAPGIQKVAVTVSPSDSQLAQLADAGFTYIQIHGALSGDLLKQVQCPVIRAVNVPPEGLTGAFCESVYRETEPANITGVLIDASVPGSGRCFDWQTAQTFAARIRAQGKRLFIAGGLHPGNVQKAIRQLAPDAVDVSSGVEYRTEPLKGKDPVRVAAFIKAVRGVF